MNIIKTLLEITAYSSVIFVVIMLFRYVFRNKISPRLQMCIWMLFILRLVVPFTLDSNIRLITLPSRQEPQVVQQVVPAAQVQQDEKLPQPAAPMQANVPQDKKAPQGNVATATASPVKLDAYDLAVIAWLAVALAGLAALAVRKARFSKQVGLSSQPVNEDIRKLYDTCRDELGIRRKIPLIISSCIDTPCITSALRPCILLPTGIARSADEQKIYFVLLHELTHYKHRDHLISLILSLVKAAHWFNPFVHIAMASIRLDMEIYCDSDVQQHIGEAGVNAYRTTIVNLFTRGKAHPALGMANSAGKRAAKKRISGMFMRPRAGSGAKLAAAVLAVLITGMCFTTACQPIEDTVAGAAGDPAIADIYSKPMLETSTVKWQREPADDGFLTINVDAEIEAPDISAAPTIKMQAGLFGISDAERAIDVFLEGQPVYEPKTQMTRAEIQTEIEDYERKLAELDPANYIGNPGPVTYDGEKQQYTDYIEAWKKKLETAPDEVERRQAKLEFHPRSYYDDDMNNVYLDVETGPVDSNGNADEEPKALIIDADIGNGEYNGRVEIDSYYYDNTLYNTLAFSKYKAKDDRNQGFGDNDMIIDPVEASEISQAEAQTMAERVVQDFAGEGWMLSNAFEDTFYENADGEIIPINPRNPAPGVGDGQPQVYSHVFMFMRMYNGMEQGLRENDYYTIGTSGLLYNLLYRGSALDELMVMVTDDGVIGFVWRNRSVPTQQSVDAKLMDVEQVKQRALEECANLYGKENITSKPAIMNNYEMVDGATTAEPNTVSGVGVDISGMKLCMLNVPDKSTPGKSEVQPVWVVQGSVNIDFPGKGQEYFQSFAQRHDMFALSAIDGRLIAAEIDDL